MGCQNGEKLDRRVVWRDNYPMDWDTRIEEFLDVHRFGGVARQKMKANLMKLPEDKRARFIDQRMEPPSQPPQRLIEPTPHPAPARPIEARDELFAIRHAQLDLQPCERCGGEIDGLLHHTKGLHFDDGRGRGYFCSRTCLSEAFDHEHFGSPHQAFTAGDMVVLMDDLWMMNDEETYQDEYSKGQKAQILTDPEWCSDNAYAVGKDGSLELPAPYRTVSLLCEGRKYDNVYVGTLGFKDEGELSLLQKIFG